MMGAIEGPERGIVPRLCGDLFSHIAQQRCAGVDIRTHDVVVSYMEIYCEKVHDLLSKKDSSDLQVRQHPEKGVCCVCPNPPPILCHP